MRGKRINIHVVQQPLLARAGILKRCGGFGRSRADGAERPLRGGTLFHKNPTGTGACGPGTHAANLRQQRQTANRPAAHASAPAKYNVATFAPSRRS